MLFTVFTATYNRARLLPRLYTSLKRQQFTDFEWIIVDDESSDNTRQVVESFTQVDNPFPIFYYQQKHGGKHRAINYSLQKATGEFFFIVDSDDFLTDDALQLAAEWVQTIRNEPKLCGVAGLKESESGEIWGEFSSDQEYIDAGNLERKQYHLGGDKAEIYLTACMRNHLFPEFEGEYFMTEAYSWNAIAAEGLKLRWFNKPIYVCEYLDDGLTKKGANDVTGHMKNFQGYACYTRQCLDIKKKTDSYREFRDYQKTCKLMNLSFRKQAEGLYWSQLKYLAYCSIIVPWLHIVKKYILKCVKKT